MSSTTELAELHELIGGLRRYVASLRSRYRDTPAMRRVVIDVDAGELDLAPHPPTAATEQITITDAPYDTGFWRDVDDEGVGGHSR